MQSEDDDDSDADEEGMKIEEEVKKKIEVLVDEMVKIEGE